MRKVVLITGASSGLGKSIVNKLADNNFIVYAGVRTLGQNDNQAKYLKLDITSDKDVSNAVKKIISKEKRIDVLINCAGATLVGPAVDITSEDYIQLFDTNVVGAFRLIRKVVPQMKHNKFGRIINITSMNAVVSFPNFGAYSSSKFAFDALSTALFYELKNSGIGITSIAPGAIYNPKANLSNFPHKPAREKFKILNILLPMVKQETIAHTIIKVIDSKDPPNRVILGRDAKLVYFMNRFLPSSLWNKIMLFIWQK